MLAPYAKSRDRGFARVASGSAKPPPKTVENLTAAFGLSGNAPHGQHAHQSSEHAAAGQQTSIVFPVIQEPEPAIVHYAWSNFLPAAFGEAWVLLTTVYDEEFAPYIQDLVNANPAPFTAAAKVIKDYDQTKVPVDEHLAYFVDFIQQRDLAQSGRAPASGFVSPACFAAYGWTVRQIYKKMPA